MSDDELRIKVAELCGFSPCPAGGSWMKSADGEIHPLPDYPNDLDAMHEVERSLPAIKRDEFIKWLSIIVERERRMAEVRWLCINASARQRALAFVKTMEM